MLNFAFNGKFHGNFIFLANGYILRQNSRKLTPLKISFYCQGNITRPPFLMLGSGIILIWCHFYSCFLSNWLSAEKISNCSNSLNFEAKINCNTNKPNVPKWRKRCTGLKHDLVPFDGPQMQFLSDHNFEGPCTLKQDLTVQGCDATPGR